MPRFKHILALDPSGNFEEGKGTTGWVLMNYKEKLIASGSISAKNYKSCEEYWNAILDLVKLNNRRYEAGGFVLVLEDYVLYRDKATSQTNSKMETCRLLGMLQFYCWEHNITYHMQLATAVKKRWSDELLLRERILYEDRDGLHHTDTGFKMSLSHVRDAFRHAIHFCLCNNEEKTVVKPNKRYSFENYTGGYNNYGAQPNYQSRPRQTTIHTSTNSYSKGNRTRTRVWRA